MGVLGIFGAMRHRAFQLYWTGMILSVLAPNMEFVAIAGLVLDLTNSPVLLGLTAMVNAAPIIALNLIGGAAADRMNRQRLLQLVQAVSTILYFALAFLIATKLVQFWHVLVFAFVIGSARAFDGPTRMALMPQVVPRDDLPSAVSLINVVWQLPRLVGPAVAGVLIATVGIGPSFLFSGIGALGALIAFSALRLSQPVVTGQGSFFKDILEGLRYIRSSPVISTLIAMTFFNSVFGMSYIFMEAVFARDVLDVGSEGFGLMETAGGLGALVGVLAAAHFTRQGKKGRQAIVGSITFGSSLVAFAWTPWFAVSLALLFLAGLFCQLYMTTILTALQLTVPDEVKGRVLGLFGLTYSLIPLGATISGTITQLANAPIAVSLGGLAVAALAIVVALEVPRVRDLA
ncbi:MAG TPA: MFS transporter [Chloroflexota bacterium]